MNSLLAVACEFAMAMNMPLQNVKKGEGVLETEKKWYGDYMFVTFNPLAIFVPYF
jgi:hypothetical protein